MAGFQRSRRRGWARVTFSTASAVRILTTESEWKKPANNSGNKAWLARTAETASAERPGERRPAFRESQSPSRLRSGSDIAAGRFLLCGAAIQRAHGGTENGW